MEHDPFVANASARDLIRLIDADPCASQRERRVCEFLAGCMKETSAPLEAAESRADEAEEKAQDLESAIELAIKALRDVANDLESSI